MYHQHQEDLWKQNLQCVAEKFGWFEQTTLMFKTIQKGDPHEWSEDLSNPYQVTPGIPKRRGQERCEED